MKRPIAAAAPLFAAFASINLVAAAVDLSSIPRETTNPTVPGAYIVELDPTAVGPAPPSGKRSPNVPPFLPLPLPPAGLLSLTLTPLL